MVRKVKHVAFIRGRIGFRGYTSTDLVSAGEGALTFGATQINPHDELDLSQPEYLSWDKYHESPEIKLEVGDVLVVQRGATIGKCAIVDHEIGPATINPSMILLRPTDISSRYLWYFLQTSMIRTMVEMVASATAIPMITQAQVSNWQLMIPNTLEEQGRICSRLDERLRKTSDLQSAIQMAISRSKHFRLSLINAAVTGHIDVSKYRM